MNQNEEIEKIRQQAELEISQIREKENVRQKTKFWGDYLHKHSVGSYRHYYPLIDIQLYENGMIILGRDKYRRRISVEPGEKYTKIIAVYDRNNKLIRIRKEPYEIIDNHGNYIFLNDFEVLNEELVDVPASGFFNPPDWLWRNGKYYEFFRCLESKIAEFREQPRVKIEFVKLKAEARVRRIKRKSKR